MDKKINIGHVFCFVSSKNTEQFSKLALDSFFKNTKLTKDDWFIFINNDNTGSFVNDYPFNAYISNTNPKSWAANFNQGLEYAKKMKKHFVVITNDIIFTPNWLEPLTQRDDCVLIPSCNINYVYKNDDFKFDFLISIFLLSHCNAHNAIRRLRPGIYQLHIGLVEPAYHNQIHQLVDYFHVR